MSSFVLVHGGAHGAWCWERLLPHLRADPRVETAIAVDLPGHGAKLDSAPQDEISLRDYIDDLVREVETRGLRDVVLVGHSLAGITVPRAAARLGARMRHLVFLSTVNPPAGSSVEDAMKDPQSPLARGVDDRTMFCNDLDEQSAEWLLSQLGPEPPGPMAERLGRLTLPPGLPTTYVLLERDEALPPEFQHQQARNAGAGEIVSLDAGHSAFVSRPRELAELLLRLA